MSTKATYKDATRKKAVRKFLFSFFNEKNIVGLAGPDIKEYISWCKENGIDNIELWENDPNVMFEQLKKRTQRLVITLATSSMLSLAKIKYTTSTIVQPL